MDDLIFVRAVKRLKPKASNGKKATPTEQAMSTDLPPYTTWFDPQVVVKAGVKKDAMPNNTTAGPVGEVDRMGDDLTTTLAPHSNSEALQRAQPPAPPSACLADDNTTAEEEEEEEASFLAATRAALEKVLGKDTLERLEQCLIQDSKATNEYVTKLENAVKERYHDFGAPDELLEEKMKMLQVRARGGDESAMTERQLLQEEKQRMEGEVEDWQSKVQVLCGEVDTLRAVLERERNEKAKARDVRKMNTSVEQEAEAKAREKLQKKLRSKMAKRKKVEVRLREENVALKKKIEELDKTLRESGGAAGEQQARQDLEAITAAKDKHIESLRSQIVRLEQVVRRRNDAIFRLHRSSGAKTKVALENDKNNAVHAKVSLEKRLSGLMTQYRALFDKNFAMVQKIQDMAKASDMDQMGSVLGEE